MTEDLVLNVTRLRVLRELAARGSIAAVADALWLTPSAVSQQLTALERETHRKLIEKAGRGVRLTDAGRVLAEASEPVFRALEDASAALQGLDSEPAGRIRVASYPSIVRIVLPRLVSQLRERHPQLVVEVEDLEGEQSLDALRVGRVDLAIIDDLGWDAGAKREGIVVTELFSDRLVVVFPSGHPLAGKDSVEWSELADFELICEQRDSLFAHTVESECRRAGFEPRVNARVHDSAAMLAFVEAGVSIAVLTELAVTRSLSPDVGWRPLTPTVERKLLAATREGKADTPALRALLEALQAVDPAAFLPDTAERP